MTACFPISIIENYFDFDDVGLAFLGAAKISSAALVIHCLTAFKVWWPLYLWKLELKTGYESLHLFLEVFFILKRVLKSQPMYLEHIQNGII